jgi:hypothetical protein
VVFLAKAFDILRQNTEYLFFYRVAQKSHVFQSFANLTCPVSEDRRPMTVIFPALMPPQDDCLLSSDNRKQKNCKSA